MGTTSTTMTAMMTTTTTMTTTTAAIEEIYAAACAEGRRGKFNASRVKPLNFLKALKALIVKFSSFTSVNR